MTDEELIARLREIQGQAGLFASAAADRIEALVKERDEHRRNWSQAFNANAALLERVNETPKTEHDAVNVLTPAPDAAAIREAWGKAYWRMRSYAVHDNDCKLNKPPRFDGPCSCGLTAALEEALALLTEGTIRKSKTVADDWECPIGAEGCHKNCGSYGCGN